MAINLELEITVDDKGAITAVRKIGDETENAGKKGKAAGDSINKAFSNLQNTLIAQFATWQMATRLMGQMWEGIKGAAQEQRAVAGLAAQLKDLGVNVQFGKARIEEFANAMKLAGFEDEQTRAAIARMLPVTKDLEKAIIATNVAYGASIKYNKDVAETMELVVGLMIGADRSLITAQKQFGILIDENLPKSKQFQQALDQLSASTKGVADTTRDATARIAGLGIMMDDLKKGIGQDLIPYFIQFDNLLRTFNLDLKGVLETTARYGYAVATLGASEGLRSLLGFFRDAPREMALMSGHAQNLGPALMSGHGGLTTIATDAKAAATAVKELDAAIVQFPTGFKADLFKSPEMSSGIFVGQQFSPMAAPPVVPTPPDPTAWQQFWQGFSENGVTAMQMVHDAGLQVSQVLEQAWGNFFGNVLSGQMSLGDATLQLGQMLLQGFGNILGQMLAQWAMFHMQKAALSMFGAKAELAAKTAEASGTTAANAAIIASEGAKTAAKTGSAAAGFFEAHSWIPWVGAAIAIGFIALMMSTLKNQQAQSQKVKGFASGTDYVPQTGLALIHKGEAIIPATANARPYTVGRGDTFNNVSFGSVTVDSPQRVQELAEEIVSKIERGQVRLQVN